MIACCDLKKRKWRGAVFFEKVSKMYAAPRCFRPKLLALPSRRTSPNSAQRQSKTKRRAVFEVRDVGSQGLVF